MTPKFTPSQYSSPGVGHDWRRFGQDHRPPTGFATTNLTKPAAGPACGSFSWRTFSTHEAGGDRCHSTTRHRNTSAPPAETQACAPGAPAFSKDRKTWSRIRGRLRYYGADN